MTTLSRRRIDHRLVPLLTAAALVVMGGCVAGALWSRAASGADPLSLDGARQAYARVTVNVSTRSDLSRLGFDGRVAGARTLSGLGVQEYFMPRTSRQFDALAPAIRACFEGQDRCTALVIPLAAPGGGLLAAQAAAPAGRVVFLLRSGRVAYKELVEG